MASGEEAAELGDADSGLMWKPHSIEVTGIIIIIIKKTLPKALRTQALTALTSNCGLVGLVQYAWKAMFDLFW